VQLARHGRMSDIEILREVTPCAASGPWTGQMYLMNHAGTRDVWPSVTSACAAAGAC